MEQGPCGRIYEDRVIVWLDRLYLPGSRSSGAFHDRCFVGGGSIALGLEAMVWGNSSDLPLPARDVLSELDLPHVRAAGVPLTRRGAKQLGRGRLVFGEGWHNNHHAFSIRSSRPRPPSVDVSWWVIHGLERVGLVWNVKVHRASSSHAAGFSRRADEAPELFLHERGPAIGPGESDELATRGAEGDSVQASLDEDVAALRAAGLCALEACARVARGHAGNTRQPAVERAVEDRESLAMQACKIELLGNPRRQPTTASTLGSSAMPIDTAHRESSRSVRSAPTSRRPARLQHESRRFQDLTRWDLREAELEALGESSHEPLDRCTPCPEPRGLGFRSRIRPAPAPRAVTAPAPVEKSMGGLARASRKPRGAEGRWRDPCRATRGTRRGAGVLEGSARRPTDRDDGVPRPMCDHGLRSGGVRSSRKPCTVGTNLLSDEPSRTRPLAAEAERVRHHRSSSSREDGASEHRAPRRERRQALARSKVANVADPAAILHRVPAGLRREEGGVGREVSRRALVARVTGRERRGRARRSASMEEPSKPDGTLVGGRTKYVSGSGGIGVTDVTRAGREQRRGLGLCPQTAPALLLGASPIGPSGSGCAVRDAADDRASPRARPSASTVGRSSQVTFRSSARPARNVHSTPALPLAVLLVQMTVLGTSRRALVSSALTGAAPGSGLAAGG